MSHCPTSPKPLFHPWRAIRDLHDWTVHFTPLPGSQLGLCDWGRKAITIHPGLSQRVRRSVATHEWIHSRRGPFLAAQHAAEEALVDREAAFWLIDYQRLLRALQWSHHLDEIAEELWTTRNLVTIRLRHLHPAESMGLTRALGPDWKKELR